MLRPAARNGRNRFSHVLRDAGAAGLALLLSACAMDLEDPELALVPSANEQAANEQAIDERAALSRPAADTATRLEPSAAAGERGRARAPSARSDAGFFARLNERINKAFEPEKPSLKEQQRLGDRLAQRILKDARLSGDARMKARLERIVARLKKAADATHPIPWRVHLLQSAKADAFTAGGGHLFITTAMVRLLEKDERIATVLAHEMAHNLLRHILLAREKKEMARRAQAFSREVLAGKMNMDWLGKSVNFLVLASLNTYSRQQENEADAEGLDILVRAGYAPQVALETFDYLQRHFRDQPTLTNFFYGIHPNYSARRLHLANLIRAHYRKQAGLPPVRRSNWRKGPPPRH